MPRDVLDDAAVAALYRIANEPREHIGLLYEQGGTIASTPTAATGASSAKGTFAIPAGSLRGLFHQHPENVKAARGIQGQNQTARTDFSRDDINQAQKVGVPSYIAAGDLVKRYDPTTGETAEVLAQFPWDEQRRKIMVELLRRLPDDPRGVRR